MRHEDFQGTSSCSRDTTRSGQRCLDGRDGARGFTRTLKVRTDTSVTPASGDAAYKATVTGTWRAIASWDQFTIVGPGAINGHQGWVNAKGGGVVNMAVYSGLEANHSYTVLYQPVVGQGSSKAIPGTHQGYVYFVSNNP